MQARAAPFTVKGIARALAESGVTDLLIRQQGERWVAWYDYHEGKTFNGYRTAEVASLDALLHELLLERRIPLEGVVSPLLEIEASELIGCENVNWRYCKQHATFAHIDPDACEFILQIGIKEFFMDRVQEMKQYGCTTAFIEAYTQAWRAGATRVLFYV